jgi:2'-5' RNA ligase
MMRLFVAINFNETVLGAIERSLDDFPVKRPPWRWTKRSTWHVTLKFVGEVEPNVGELVSRLLGDVAARHDAFDTTIGNFGGFPNLHRPRVLFYEALEGVEHMGALSEDINRVLAAEAGIRAETKPFRAHVTVARVKTRIGKPAVDALRSMPPLEGAVQRVVGFDLMRSQLERKGATYTRLKEFALG